MAIAVLEQHSHYARGNMSIIRGMLNALEALTALDGSYIAQYRAHTILAVELLELFLEFGHCVFWFSFCRLF